MTDRLLIYGSYGFTGSLIARLAVQRGLRPILAGRDPERLAAQAVELGLEHVAFSLNDRAATDLALQNATAVLHCAGPFVHTARPMVDACLRTGAHYLDITGEIAVFEALAARDTEASAAGVMLLPGVGFDVVPSDCLAAHLKRRLPSATRLILGIKLAGSQSSHGTMNSAIEALPLGGKARRDGMLVDVPLGTLTRQIDFGRGPRPAVAVPWGDVSTAWRSTGIPNIEVYFAWPAAMRWGMVATRYLRPLLATKIARGALKRLVAMQPPGPSQDQREAAFTLLYGEVLDDAGGRRVSRLRTPESYRLTAETALASAVNVLAGCAVPGFQTPSRLFGPDFIMEFEHVEREDILS
ncbi:MAG: saccharopine dehydrogenase NADP-binding domain-containing protein [Anaerolineae bacterium]|nr:saccharopine dehydrogenase NADP-binding domain-containing protein [Anaerolineae bacterium]